MKKYNGKLIFEEREAQGVIQVVDRPGIRTLHFGTATEQSSMYLEKPFDLEMEYIRTMALALLFRPDVKKALTLGIGGGSLPKFIWKYFPDCHVSALEMSSLVIDVAHRFFYLPQDPRLKVICDDALHFLRTEPTQQEDLIFADLYISKGMAPAVTEPDFFTRCDAWLKPGGILVWNMWRSSGKDIIEQCLLNLSAVFGRNLLILPTEESGNFIILAFKDPIANYSKEQIEEEASKLQNRSSVEFLKLLQRLHYFKGYGYLFQDF